MITQTTIQQILSRIDILDVIGSFVKLKKRGANYLGNCPFHNERTPSFTVSPSKEIFKCFGCGKSGNTISFIMEHEKLSYVEALRWLAARYNIEVEETERTPEQKLQTVADLNAQAPTVMVGDGINDAPALAKATIGISMSDATQIAMQSAQVVLMNSGLTKLPTALGLGRHTYLTIKQNLFWAFFYNIIAIPVAALGFLTPMFGALVMGLSDVVLAINSVRLFVKKVV